jgi:hypothetical protein
VSTVSGAPLAMGRASTGVVDFGEARVAVGSAWDVAVGTVTTARAC